MGLLDDRACRDLDNNAERCLLRRARLNDFDRK